MSFKAVLEADIKGFTSNIDKAMGAVDKLEKTTLQKLSKVGDSFVSIGKKASILSVALVGVGAKAFSMAASFEDAMGATDQVFKTSSEEIQNWAKNLSSEYGVAKKEALEYANLMGTMLKNIGNLTEREASKQAQTLVELAGDLTAMYGGTTSEAINALTASLRGINVPIAKYGVGINDALVKAKAFEMGISSLTGELSIQARQAATLQLIWDQTADAQGQAAREADTASGAMRAFRTEVANLSTELGETLLPIITPMISKLTEATNSFRGLSPEMQSMIVGVAGVTAVAGPLLVVIGNILKALPLIKAALGALTGPVGLIVAAIAGAAILIIKNWDSIKEYFTSGGGSELFDSIKNLFSAAKEYISIVFSQIKTVITTIWNAIGDTLIKVFGNSFDTIMTVVTTAIDIVSGVLNTFINLLKGDFSGALESVKTLGKNVFDGLKNIVFNSLSSMTAALSKFFSFLNLNSLAETFADWSEKIKPSTKKIVNDISTVNNEIKKTAVVTDTATQSITGLTKELDTFQKLIGEQLNVRDAITKTTATIEDLQSKLVKLQLGILPSTNVRQELADTQQQINDLSTALDLLTGDRELNIKVNVTTSGVKADENKFFKDGKFVLPPIDTSALEDSMGDLSQKAQAIEVTVGDVLGNLFADASTAIMEGDNVMTALGASMLGMLGGIMVDLGKMALSTGIGLEAIQKALMSLNPALAIGAGVALIAMGSLFSAGARKLGQSMGGSGGGGYSSAPSMQNSQPALGNSDYRGAYQDDFKVEFKIGSNELVGVLDTANQRRNRLG